MLRGVRAAVATVALATFLAPATPAAAPATEQLSPRLQQVTIDSAALGRPAKLRVLLPTSYRSGARRYPVLYLFAGVGDNHTTWTNRTDLEVATAGTEVIVVMPEGGSGATAGWASDWYNGGAHGPPRWATHHLREIIPFVDSTYRTVPARSHRLIAGTSMGGFAAMSYAARHPDLFVAAASMSGAVDTLLAEPASGLGFHAFATQLGTPSHAVWGEQQLHELRWRAHNPSDLVANLKDVALWIVTGDGRPASGDNPLDAPVEAGVARMNEAFRSALLRASVPHYYEMYSPGTHEWSYRQREIRRVLRYLLDAVGRETPRTFSYRTAARSFVIYGWRFEVQRDVDEFLALTDVSPVGLIATGTGRLSVTTPPIFRPGETIDVGDRGTLVADPQGRLRLMVDLGRSNSSTEFTPRSDAEKQVAGATYFRTTSVRFARR